MNLSEDNVFVGLMLSDAHIKKFRSMSGKTSLEIKQKAERKAFLEAIQDHFHQIGLESQITKEYIANYKYPQHMLYTPAKLEIGDERKHWYPNGIKRVPRDLKLNGEVLAWWMYGDGGSEWCGTNNNSVKVILYTNSFPMNDIEFLRNQLKDLGIENTTHMKKSDEPVIHISQATSVQKLMDMVKPYILPVFQYKMKEPHLIDFGDQEEKQRIRSREAYQKLNYEEKKTHNQTQWERVKDKKNPERNDRYKNDPEYKQHCLDRSNRNYTPHPRIREIVTCVFCHSNNTRKHGKITTKTNSYERVKCNDCKHLFQHNNKEITVSPTSL